MHIKEKAGSASIKMMNCTAKTSIYKCISLVLDPPLYIASPKGLISFPAGFLSVAPPIAVTTLCYYNIGYVTKQIGLLVRCGFYVVDKKNNKY